MKSERNYHKWVEWSVEDDCFVAFCPDLFRGGICHGPDEAEVYARLVEIVNEEIEDLQSLGKPLPDAKLRPTHALSHV